MKIELKKFGKVLTFRPSGKEAFLAIRPVLDPGTDKVEIDFTDVLSLSPGWADEFFRPLEKMYDGRVVYLPSDNLSVKTTLKILQKE